MVTSFIGHGKGTNTLAFSPDGKWLASAGKDNTILLILMVNSWLQLRAKENMENLHKDQELPSDIAISPDGNYLAVSYGVIEGNDSIMIGSSFDFPKGLFGRVCYWNIKNGTKIASNVVHWMDTNAIAFSPDGKCLASVSGGRKNNRVRPPYSG